MKTKIYLSAIAMLMTSACSTTYFHNSGIQNDQVDYSEWHHDGILGLVEFSDPVDLNARCEGNNWQTIRTQQTFVQGLIGVVPIVGALYNPQEAAYSCVKVAAVNVSKPPMKAAAPAAKAKKKKN